MASSLWSRLPRSCCPLSLELRPNFCKTGSSVVLFCQVRHLAVSHSIQKAKPLEKDVQSTAAFLQIRLHQSMEVQFLMVGNVSTSSAQASAQNWGVVSCEERWWVGSFCQSDRASPVSTNLSSARIKTEAATLHTLETRRPSHPTPQPPFGFDQSREDWRLEITKLKHARHVRISGAGAWA